MCQPAGYVAGYRINKVIVYRLIETYKTYFFKEMVGIKEYREPEKQKKGKIIRFVGRGVWRK